MLPIQVALTLLAFAAAALLFLSDGHAAIAGYHIVFAVGILPLILAAMTHFVPVLTRSGRTGRLIRFVPPVALAGGFLIVLYFTQPQLAPAARPLGTLLSAGAVAALAAWAWQLRRNTIGAPHPCLDWYLAALACLLAGLCAILVIHWLPDQRAALRRLHLHLNVLGFIGITALGTLQVLLPTVAQKPDPGAAGRMRRHLKWMVAGTLATACAVAWHPALAWIGMGLLAIPPVGIFIAWRKLYARQIFTLHGAMPPLAAALAGYVAVLALAAANGYFRIGFDPIPAFIVAFLMPLVTGAAAYLLPLWLRPGRQTSWHRAARRQLGYGGGARATILLAGGILAGLGLDTGWALAFFAASTFIIQLLLMRALA